MRLSGTVTEIWRLKDNGGHEFYLLESRDVIGHVTIRLPGADFLSMVHSVHASIWHHYEDMAPQILDARTWTQKERRKNGKRKGEGKRKEKESGRGKGKKRGRRKEMQGKEKGRELKR